MLVNVLQPGKGLSDETRARMMAGAAERSAALAKAPAPKSGIDLVTEIVPANPLKAAVDGDMLAVMFFALMFGIGLSLTRTEAARRFEEMLEGLYDVTMRLIAIVISLAPIGVAALLFTLTADLGFEILVQLARYVGVVVLALAIHQFVVYSAAGRTARWHEPARLLPRHPGGDDHGVLDRLVATPPCRPRCASPRRS